MVLFLRKKWFNVNISDYKWGGGEYQLRSAHAKLFYIENKYFNDVDKYFDIEDEYLIF